MSHFLQNHMDGLDQRWQRNLYSRERNLFLNIYSSCLQANKTSWTHPQTCTHIHTHTNEEQLSKENILRLKKEKGKETKGEQKMLSGTKQPQTNTQSKFNTMPCKTKLHYSSGHNMRTHTGCDYRSTQASLHQSKHTDKSSVTKSIWHAGLEGWNPTLGKITNTLKFKL